MCKAQKESFGQVAAATVLATSVLAGVRGGVGWGGNGGGGAAGEQAPGSTQPPCAHAHRIRSSDLPSPSPAPAPHPRPRRRRCPPCAQSANALTYDELQGLTYLQVKGTGIANTCPVIDQGSTKVTVGAAGRSDWVGRGAGVGVGGHGLMHPAPSAHPPRWPLPQPQDLKAGNYKLEKFCMEPTSFQVKEEVGSGRSVKEEFVDTKLMTRLTYTLDGVSSRALRQCSGNGGSLGPHAMHSPPSSPPPRHLAISLPPPSQMNGSMKVGSDGSVQFKEDDGLDYAATTVQLPGGERVAFLFTIKEFEGKGTLDSFSGDFTVPSYRGSTFLDPKVRRAAA